MEGSHDEARHQSGADQWPLSVRWPPFGALSVRAPVCRTRFGRWGAGRQVGGASSLLRAGVSRVSGSWVLLCLSEETGRSSAESYALGCHDAHSVLLDTPLRIQVGAGGRCRSPFSPRLPTRSPTCEDEGVRLPGSCGHIPRTRGREHPIRDRSVDGSGLAGLVSPSPWDRSRWSSRSTRRSPSEEGLTCPEFW